MSQTIKEKIEYIYGSEATPDLYKKVLKLIEDWKVELPGRPDPGKELPLTEKDTILITYGDNIKDSDSETLKAFNEFAVNNLKGHINTVHFLPFFPYTSDDGFSVVDYRKINPPLGDWEDVQRIGKSFKLMFDLVLNHCSAKSDWFQKYLERDPKYRDYFIDVDPDIDLSAVFRPRALPLLTEFDTEEGKKHVWTTFSADQVDLNFSNPDVFLEFADIFLFFVSQGARIVRLDAIGFLWKEIGTSCMHHPKTHAAVQLFRLILEQAAPGTVLLTETNVPHKENISYFGDGDNEAQMVYQFSLPPLTLDAFVRGDASHLTEWASQLPPPVKENSYFNFLASHDGVGVLPARGYLSDDELDSLIEVVEKRGGRVSYKNIPGGKIPYELNISYFNAIAETELSDKERIRKFLCSQAVMLCMAGVPGIYIHSLLGSQNWQEGVKIHGANRSINREKMNREALEKELHNPASLRYGIFEGYKKMLAVRQSSDAFKPSSGQTVLDMDKAVFAVLRSGSTEEILCLQNSSSQNVPLDISGYDNQKDFAYNSGGNQLDGDSLVMEPWGCAWIRM